MNTENSFPFAEYIATTHDALAHTVNTESIHVEGPDVSALYDAFTESIGEHMLTLIGGAAVEAEIFKVANVPPACIQLIELGVQGVTDYRPQGDPEFMPTIPAAESAKIRERLKLRSIKETGQL